MLAGLYCVIAVERSILRALFSLNPRLVWLSALYYSYKAAREAITKVWLCRVVYRLDCCLVNQSQKNAMYQNCSQLWGFY